jgi:hypothetical protein
MQADPSISVYLRSPAGDYLAHTADGWGFVSDPDRAHIFDYHADAVPQQLEAVQRDLGLILIAWPCDPNLVRETCDLCGKQLFPTAAIFDGSRFLCRPCYGSRTQNPGSAP